MSIADEAVTHDLGSIFTNEAAYADDESWHRAATILRREHPVFRVEQDGWEAVWAIMKHADIMAIERRSDIFLSTDWVIFQPVATMRALEEKGLVQRTIMQMDSPEHKKYRDVTIDWFAAGALKRTMQARLEELAREYVDRLVQAGGECDFATEVANLYPLRVIMSMMGVAEEDEAKLLALTHQTMASSDPEFAKHGDGATDYTDALGSVIAHLSELTGRRRSEPTDDIASVIANGRVDGELMGEAETNFYYAILAIAGHDTVSSTITGGLEALIRHPEALRDLQADPGLIPNAVEEILRWASPAKGFTRLATEDYQLRGTTIKAGERVLLSWPSANRDEEVFAEPFRFDIRRPNANKHIAFGFGKHHCIGAMLARMELRALFAELVARLEEVEIVGEVERSHSNMVSGIKHLPIRYRLHSS